MSYKTLQAKLQKFFRTDLTYLAKGGFWLSVSYFLQIGVGLVTITVVANMVPKSVFGTYQFVLAMAGILSVCTLSGIQKAVTRSVAHGNDGILPYAVYTKMRWNLIIVGLSGCIAAYYGLQDNLTLAYSFLIVGACSPFIESFKLYNSFLHGKEAFRDSTLLGFWRKPLPLVTICITAFYTDSVVALVAAYFLSSAISYVAIYLSVIKKYKPAYTPDPEALTYSKHLSVITVIGQIAQHADKIILWQVMGSIAVAGYSIAQLTTKYAGGLLNVFSVLAFPKISKRDLPTLQRTLPRKVFLFMGVMLAFVIVYVLLAPFVFALLFPEYPEAVLISQLLALGLIFLPQSLFGTVFTAHMQVRTQYTLGVALPVLKLLLLVLLVPTYEIFGVVAATLIAETVSFFVRYYYFMTAVETSSPETTPKIV